MKLYVLFLMAGTDLNTIMTTGEAVLPNPPDITGVTRRIAGIAVALTIVIVVVAAITVLTVIVIVLRKKKMLYFVKPRSTLGRNGVVTESTVRK